MQKRKLHNKNLSLLTEFFLSLVVAVSFSYLMFSAFTGYIGAQTLTIFDYLGNKVVGNRDVYPVEDPGCPRLVKVETLGGAVIVKDECTNLFWHRFDLPVKNPDGVAEGYTWVEAKNACESLAVTTDRGALLRLPTADELLSLTYTPCTQPGNGCSPIVNQDAKYAIPDDEEILPLQNQQEYHLRSPGYLFAEGAYWSADQLDMDGSKTLGEDNTYEAASSVNLYYGTVNNPVFGKNVRLNVRCVYDKLLPDDYGTDYTVTPTDFAINEVQWWARSNEAFPQGGVTAMKASIGYRLNMRPFNGDVNNCPEGVNSTISGEYNLCAGISSMTDQFVVFDCGALKPRKRFSLDPLTEPPVRCVPAASP